MNLAIFLAALWWAAKTRAGGEPPVLPRTGAGHPQPGHPSPTGPAGPVRKRIDVIDCGSTDRRCTVVYDCRTRQIRVHRCPDHYFDVDEWNARLEQS